MWPPLITVKSSLRIFKTVKDNLAALRILAQETDASVALIVARGGGWDAGELPSVRDIPREPKLRAPASTKP
jgi:hypothetical protein